MAEKCPACGKEFEGKHAKNRVAGHIAGRVATKDAEHIKYVEEKTGSSRMCRKVLNKRLVQAIIQVESSGDPKCVGNAGERGLMQIMEKTWVWICKDIIKKDYSWDDAFDPEINVEVGTAYLKWLVRYLRERRGKLNAPFLDLLLACYNAGQGRVMMEGFRVPPIESTKRYIQKVKQELEKR